MKKLFYLIVFVSFFLFSLPTHAELISAQTQDTTPASTYLLLYENTGDDNYYSTLQQAVTAILGASYDTSAELDALFAAKQGLDADLTAVAALTTDPYGLALLETTDEATLKALINLEAGTDFYSISAADSATTAAIAAISWIGGDLAGTGLAPQVVEGSVDHDSLANFVDAEHYRWDLDISGTATIDASNIPGLPYEPADAAITKTDEAETITENWDFSGDIIFTEKADHSSTPGAGKGYLWVKNDTPNTIIYTDDAGTDTVLGAAGSDAYTVKIDVGATAGYLGAADSDGVLRTSTGLTYADGGNFITLSVTDNYALHAGDAYTGTHDFSGVTVLKIDQGADCSGVTGEGDICWDTDDNTLYVGDSVAASSVGGAADAFTVKIDAAATAGYIGAADSDGVLRAGTGITYADGGNYVTLSVTDNYALHAGDAYTGTHDFSGATALTLDQAADCSAVTGEGNICWDTDDNVLYIGDGAAAALGGGYTVDVNELTLTGNSFGLADHATARSALGLGTADSPQFSTIELGAATDTTIARSGAGAITVEGTAVLLAGDAAALTGTINADEITVFSDATTLKALTESEFKTAYNMEAGTDYEGVDAEILRADTADTISAVLEWQNDVYAAFGNDASVGGSGDYMKIGWETDLSGFDDDFATALSGEGLVIYGEKDSTDLKIIFSNISETGTDHGTTAYFDNIVYSGSITADSSGESYIMLENGSHTGTAEYHLFAEGGYWSVTAGSTTERVLITDSMTHTITGEWDMSGSNYIELPQAATPTDVNADGRLYVDTSVHANWADSTLAMYNGTEIIYFVGTADTAPETDQILKVQADGTMDWAADDSAGTTAYDDIASPDANGTIDFTTYTNDWTMAATTGAIFDIDASGNFDSNTAVMRIQTTGTPTGGELFVLSSDNSNVEFLSLRPGVSTVQSNFKVDDAATFTNTIEYTTGDHARWVWTTADETQANITTPTFHFIADSDSTGMVANQDVMNVYRGGTLLMTLDEDGDLEIAGNYTTAGEDTAFIVWNYIGDASADGSVAFGGYEQTITSTLNEAAHSALIIDHTTADVTAATTLLKIQSVDNDDTDLTYVSIVDDSGGTPDTLFSVLTSGVNIGADLLPVAADGAALGSATLELSDLYLAAGGVIYGENDQGNTLTSSATGWTMNLDLTVTGGDITLGTTSIFSGGDTASLNNIDAIDATTEATIEAAVDTLGALTLSSTFTDGTLTGDGVGGITGIVNLNAVTATELAELETIGATTISAAQWSYLGIFPTDPGADRYLMWDDSETGAELIWTTIAGGGDLLANGSVPLTANWDVGAYTITGTRFISDIATGTAPFGVSSTTVVTNLNADTVDGESASAIVTAARVGGASASLDDTDASVEWEDAGSLDADGTITALSVLAGDYAAASIDGDDVNSSIAGRSLTLSAASPDTLDADAELYTDTKCMYFEDPTATDDFQSIWRNSTASDYTITEIWAESDQTVTFMLQVDDGTPADVDSVDLAPAAGEAEDTSLNGDTTLAADEELDLAVTSVANTPTWVSICWTYTKND